MTYKISIEALQEEAKQSTLKRGDRVVFDSMGGIWADLVGMTGVIKKKNKDPIWMYDVEIDFPHLLGPHTEHMRKNDFITCVGPSALHALESIPKDVLWKVNRGKGPEGFDRTMSKLVAHRRLWHRMVEMDKEHLMKTEQHSAKYGDDSDGIFSLDRAKKSLTFSEGREAKVVAEIDKLKAKGIPEPVYSADA